MDPATGSHQSSHGGGVAGGGGKVEALSQAVLHCSDAAALSLSSEVIDGGRQQQTCVSQLSSEAKGWKGDADLDKGSPTSHTSHWE